MNDGTIMTIVLINNVFYKGQYWPSLKFISATEYR